MKRYKYPRTSHFVWSKGATSDDKILHDLSNFEGKEVVCSIKMDGENANLTRDCYYARSVDSANHISRNWVKGLWGNIRHEIPENWRICGENLYATHSIHYTELESYFMVFNIWNENNICLTWDQTIEWCELLDLKPVKVIYRGIFDINIIKNLENKIDLDKDEGYVVRLADSFSYEDFGKSVVKFVRNNNVQTDIHWMNQKLIINELKK